MKPLKKALKSPISYSLQLNCLLNMISEPNDVVSVNFYVSLCASICMRLYSAVSLVVQKIALYKCTLLLLSLLLLLLLNCMEKSQAERGILLSCKM